MLLKVSWLILCNEIMQGSCEEGQVAVVVIGDGVGERLIGQREQMLKIDIEGGE